MSSIEKKIEERQSPEAVKHKISFVVPTYTGIEQNGFAVDYSLSKLFQVDRKCNECDIVCKSGFSGMIGQKLKRGLTKSQKENLEKLGSGEIAWSSSDWNIQSLSCRTQGLLLRTHHRSYAKNLQNQRICLIKRLLQRFSLKAKPKNIRPDEVGIVQKLRDTATCTVIRANVNCSSLAIAKKNFYIISEDVADTICGDQIHDYKVSTATATEYIVKDEYVESCFDFIDAKQGSAYVLTSCKDKYIPHLNINEEMETKGKRIWYWLSSFFVSSSDTPIAEKTNGEMVTEYKTQSTAAAQSVHQNVELLENASYWAYRDVYMCSLVELALLQNKCFENLTSDVSSTAIDGLKSTLPSDRQLRPPAVPEMKTNLDVVLNDFLLSTTEIEIISKSTEEVYEEKIEIEQLKKQEEEEELAKLLNKQDELKAELKALKEFKQELKKYAVLELKIQDELEELAELKTEKELMRREELKRQDELNAQEELKKREELKRQGELAQEELQRQEELKKLDELKTQEELKRREELKRKDELKRQCELKAQEELKRQEQEEWEVISKE